MRWKKLVKRSQRRYLREVVLDTSYVLPILGIEVNGVSYEILKEITERFTIYYPAILLVELIGILLKEVKRKQLREIPREAIKGFNIVIYSGLINIVLPIGDDLELIYELMKCGWRDIFDATLYATALRLNAKALTLDRTFKNFLKEHGFRDEILITHKELLNQAT